jgi:predicted nucleic acid-binding protein
MAGNPQAWLTPLHRTEWAHVVGQQVFHRRISAVDGDRAHDDFELDRKLGRWLETSVSQSSFELAVELARRHVAQLGSRTLNTLHVASALELGAREFWTFDQRQAKLAKAAGLKAT